MRSLISAVLCGVVVMVAVPEAAAADGAKCNRWTRSCKVTSQTGGSHGGNSRNSSPSSTPELHRQRAVDDRLQQARQKFQTAHMAYIRQLTTYNRCVVTFNPSSNPGGCGNRPAAPTAPMFRTNTFSGPGNPAITAGQAAAIAVARLQLPTIAPGIGPSPNLNPWNMAAVGYPLWLWADGPTHVRVRSKHENCHGESRHLRQDLV